jgi:oxygen-dependent protoporphyrinogen oxidase
MARVVVVGGGVSGLAAAYRLQQLLPDAEITLLEQQRRVGGVVGTVGRDGFRVETGPNGFLDTNPATLNLCRDLGLGGRLVPASEAAGQNRFVLLGGRLRALPGGLAAFLRSDVLSWRAKWRLVTERFRARRADSGDESVDDFARRRVGDEIAGTLADAFVTGIYAGDPKLLSLPAAFPRLAAFERDHGSVSRGFARARRQRRSEAAARGEPPPARGRMWSFAEGLQFLTDALRARLRRPPVTGVAARRVRRAAPGNAGAEWVVEGEGRDAWPADALVLTCPAYRQAELLADADPALAAEVGAVPYNRVAVVALGYRAADVPVSLDGFGYLSPQRDRRDVLGVQWCSSIFPGRAPGGAVLLRALCGGWHRPEMVDWDDDRLVGAVRAELRQALGIQASPVFVETVRWRRAIPQYHLGHLDRLARVEAAASRHPGMFLGGSCYRGVALNDCAEQGGLLAGRVAAFLADTGSSR